MGNKRWKYIRSTILNVENNNHWMIYNIGIFYFSLLIAIIRQKVNTNGKSIWITKYNQEFFTFNVLSSLTIFLFYSTFCPGQLFSIWRYFMSMFDVYPAQRVFFDIFPSWRFFHWTLCPIRRYLLRCFVRRRYFPSTFYFDILSVNKPRQRKVSTGTPWQRRASAGAPWHKRTIRRKPWRRPASRVTLWHRPASIGTSWQ